MYIEVNSWDDLRQFGINYLTGEACHYMMRGLCDLNEAGVELLTRFFGGNVTFTRNSNWNSRVNDEPAVASIMLPTRCGIELVIGEFALRNDPKIVEVWHTRFSAKILGITVDELTTDTYKKYIETCKAKLKDGTEYTDYIHLSQRIVKHKTSDQPHMNDRNVHTISGRIE